MSAGSAVVSAIAPSTLVDAAADSRALADAWHRVRSGGLATGVDRMTIDQFAAQLRTRLDALSRVLGAGRYEPGPLKRVYVPKDTGGHRPIGIPSITDRVVQTSIATLLQERFEPTFSSRSYAYRPGRGPRRAGEHALHLAQRFPVAVNSDIERFFDNVDHDLLDGLLRARGVDVPTVRVIMSCLKTPVVDQQHWLSPVKGLPQGSPLAPLLANFYLDEFDARLTAWGFEHVRFADDFIVFAATPVDGADAFQRIQQYLTTERRLRLKAAKTTIGPVASGFTFVGFTFDNDGARVAPAKIQAFKRDMTTRLRETMPPITDIVRAVNDIVRGWRNYYAHFSPGANADLEALDAWTKAECAEFLERRGHARTAAALLFESLLPSGADETAAAAATPHHYGPPLHEIESARDAASPAAVRTEPVKSARQAPTALRDVHELAIAVEQQPVLSARGDLYVPTAGAFVTKRGQTIAILRKRATVFEASLDEVRRVTLAGAGLVFSTQLAFVCAQRGIDIEFVDLAGRLIGELQGRPSRHRVVVGRAQLIATRSRRGAATACSMIHGKLRNQRALLLCLSKYAGRSAATRDRLLAAAARIDEQANAVHRIVGRLDSSIRKAVFLAEAHGAAHYWSAIGTLVPGDLGFRRRWGRGATDPVNSLLNYGYARLYARAHSALRRAQMVPWIGLLHSGRKGGAALALDFMEEFRAPVVDRTVLGLIGRGFRPVLRPDHRLSLRSRRVFEAALIRACERRSRRVKGGLDDVMRRQAGRLRRALLREKAYDAYAMTW
jgi:group II intron reverse transcriptase/maturase/CRISPR-associated endonuclease Cas1